MMVCSPWSAIFFQISQPLICGLHEQQLSAGHKSKTAPLLNVKCYTCVVTQFSYRCMDHGAGHPECDIIMMVKGWSCVKSYIYIVRS